MLPLAVAAPRTRESPSSSASTATARSSRASRSRSATAPCAGRRRAARERALLGTARALEDGHDVAFTPDGPRGPRADVRAGRARRRAAHRRADRARSRVDAARAWRLSTLGPVPHPQAVRARHDRVRRSRARRGARRASGGRAGAALAAAVARAAARFRARASARMRARDRRPLARASVVRDAAGARALARAALAPASALYRSARVSRARALYDRGHAARATTGVPALSVGNLTVGGTGKTPVAAWLAARARRARRAPAIVHARLRRRRAAGARTAQPRRPGRRRRRSRARRRSAAVTRGADVVVLDDAFQHRRAASGRRRRADQRGSLGAADAPAAGGTVARAAVRASPRVDGARHAEGGVARRGQRRRATRFAIDSAACRSRVAALALRRAARARRARARCRSRRCAARACWPSPRSATRRRSSRQLAATRRDGARRGLSATITRSRDAEVARVACDDDARADSLSAPSRTPSSSRRTGLAKRRRYGMFRSASWSSEERDALDALLDSRAVARDPLNPEPPATSGASLRPYMATDLRLPTDKIVRPDKDRFLNEENPFEAMMSRFDRAAELLDLEPGLYKVLRHPEKQIIVSVPVHDGQRRSRGLHRLSRALQHVARARQGRHPLRHAGDARGGEGARGVDDVEVRGGEPAVRRCEGRRGLRPAQDERRRAGAPHAPLHRGHHLTRSAPTPTFPRPT